MNSATVISSPMTTAIKRSPSPEFVEDFEMGSLLIFANNNLPGLPLQRQVLLTAEAVSPVGLVRPVGLLWFVFRSSSPTADLLRG